MKKNNISVVIVCYNEIKNIKDCLDSLVHQTYPKSKYEIVVVDNNSNDGTIEIIKDFVKKYKNISLIINPKRGIAGSRNIGVKRAKYSLVAFTDADCVVPKNWLENYNEAFEKYKRIYKNLAGLGSGNVPPETTNFYKALKIMLNSFLGSRGSTQGKLFKHEKLVNHIPCVNVMYKKKIISNIGWFDVSFGNIGEDQDLTFRLNKKGFKFLYIPNNIVIHKMRDNIFKWSKNMFVYGKGRMWLLKKHPQMFSTLFLAPIFLVIVLFFSFFSFFSFFFLIILATYLIFVLVYSIFLSLKYKKLFLFFLLFILFFETHIFYGMGEIYGIFRKRGN